MAERAAPSQAGDDPGASAASAGREQLSAAAPSPSQDRARSTIRVRGASDQDTTGLPRDLRALLSVAAAVGAPPALITALAYYFAVKRQETLALHFGIDTSVLGFSTQDYLLRGGDALFLVLLFVALAGLGFVRAHLALMRRLQDPRLTVPFRRAALALRVLGSALLAIGIVAVFRRLPFSPHFLFRSLSFGSGVLLMGYGTYVANRLREVQTGWEGHARHWLSSTSAVLVAVLAFLSMFWATKDLAQALGRGQAQQLEQNLALRPGVIVYSDRHLHIDGPGVTREDLDGEDAGFRYRYGGLRLLVRSGGNYFVVPEGWSRSEGAVALLSDEDAVRIEFTPGGR